MDNIRVHLIIRGLVQGVGFRWWTVQWAERLGLNGWARNKWDGSVETEVEGDRSAVEEYLKQMKVGPRGARVADVKVEFKPYQGNYKGFDITR
jgi:acylphosphatase